MDTALVREQLAFVCGEVNYQSALAGREFKFFINKNLVDYFGGNREVAFKRTQRALMMLQELGFLELKNDSFVELDYDEVDRYDSAWFVLKLKDEFFGDADDLQSSKPSFNARTGKLIIEGKTIEFEPKTRKSVILMLSLRRAGVGVGFETVNAEYNKIDGTVDLTDKQIRDDVAQINAKINRTLPEVTDFLSAKSGYVRIKQ